MLDAQCNHGYSINRDIGKKSHIIIENINNSGISAKIVDNEVTDTTFQ